MDFTAPTCAACHVSLLATETGEVVAERSHDFGSRLWVRIFGLVASHPQPKDGDTTRIRNADGQPLPTTFGGETASTYLIGRAEGEKRRTAMTAVCSACHSSNWITGFLDRFDLTVGEADGMVLAATGVMNEAWESGKADPSNPFDETMEHLWINQWLIYANSVRYAAAMSGPDYATFKNGFWNLRGNLLEMHERVSTGEASTGGEN
jgi:hypothetical protein